MLVSKELAALRSDDAPQRQAQARLSAAVEGWRARSESGALQRELERMAQGQHLVKQPRLAGLFEPGNGSAQALVEGLLCVVTAELGANPLAHPPLRHFTDGTLSTLLIARAGTVALVVQAVDGHGLKRRLPVLSTSFSPGETWEHVLAGTAEAELARIIGERPGGVDLEMARCRLLPGTINFRDGASESLLIRSAPNNLVTLKLQRSLRAGQVSRQYRLNDGQLVHQAAGSARESRLELAAALLGRMGRGDAAPLMAAMAEERGSNSLRWQALRECIALDSATGFAALSSIAARAHDPLCAAAGALRAQLLEAHPQLKETGRCQG